jgi:murein DD-endopeptidase MepM/ murein hydrolase activator NlpD
VRPHTSFAEGIRAFMPACSRTAAAYAAAFLAFATLPAHAIELHGPFVSAEAGEASAADGAEDALPGEAFEPAVLTVGRGDTLLALLIRAGLAAPEAHAAAAAITPHLPPRDLRPGHEIHVFRSSDPARTLAALAIEPSPDRRITVFATEDGRFTASVEEVERVRHLVRAEGTITASFYEDLTRASVPPALVMGLIRAFSNNVDFQRDIQGGERFAVMFERWRDPDGELMDHGDVIHAELHAGGRVHRIWRFERSDGRVEWFDENGVSVRRSLLRTPLDAARISSGFGMRRHPILGYGRMHQGVDFAAPTGTPVFAAGEGRVAFAGTRGGYGTTVVINHSAGVSTLYAHLSAIQRGLRPGSLVRQGQVIGRVGSTGMSTGPHLHFEVHRNRSPVNPALAQMMPPPRLAGPELAAFQRVRARAERQFAALAPGREIAMAE